MFKQAKSDPALSHLPLTDAPIPTVPVRVGVSIRLTDAGGSTITMDFSDQSIQSLDVLRTLREALTFLEHAVQSYAPRDK